MNRAALALACVAPLALGSPVLAQTSDPTTGRLVLTGIGAYAAPEVPFSLRGAVANDSAEALHDVHVVLHTGGSIRSRSQLHSLAEEPEGDGPTTEIDVDGVVPPGGQLPLSLDIPADDMNGLRGAEPSLHAVRIAVRAAPCEGCRQEPVAAVDTFLMWWPHDRIAATNVAWVWPLLGDTRRGPDQTFLDDGLAQELGPGGRLAGLLSAADENAPAPVTWAVDPELIAATATMAEGYQVRPPGEQERPGAGEGAARSWLEAARRAFGAAPERVLSLPYADPDVVALVRNGLTTDLAKAQGIGLRALRDRLGITVAKDLAWPPGGAVTQPAIEALAGLEVRAFVAADNAVPLVDPPTFTPTAPYDLPSGAGGSMTALVADAVFADLLAAGPGSDGPAVGVQRFLAETAMFMLERPNTGRDLVVTPPRMWDPGAGFARGLLRATADAPWLRGVPLRDLLDHSRSTYARTVSYPADAQAAELPASYFDELRAARRTRQAYVSMLLESTDPLPALLDDALLRAESAQWRNKPANGRALVSGVRQRLTDQFAQIRISSGGLVTLTSDAGRIPITVVNGLRQPVRLQLRIDTGNRLELAQGNRIELTRVNPGSVTVDVEGKALQAGQFTIDLRLETPDGTPLAPRPVALRVRSTAYGRVALYITGGAFVLLLIGSATRLVRRRRARAEAAT